MVYSIIRTSGERPNVGESTFKRYGTFSYTSTFRQGQIGHYQYDLYLIDIKNLKLFIRDHGEIIMSEDEVYGILKIELYDDYRE